MTNEEIDEFIATRVHSWRKSEHGNYWVTNEEDKEKEVMLWVRHIDVYSPITNIAQAFEALEVFIKGSCVRFYEIGSGDRYCGINLFSYESGNKVDVACVSREESLPMAICKALIQWCENKDDNDD